MASDCCCFCFSLKTGAELIGALVIINFFFLILSIVTVYSPIVTWFIPEIVFTSITMGHYIAMLKSRGTPNDAKARASFSGVYTGLYLIANMLWQFLKPVIGDGVIGDFPTDFCSISYT